MLTNYILYKNKAPVESLHGEYILVFNSHQRIIGTLFKQLSVYYFNVSVIFTLNSTGIFTGGRFGDYQSRNYSFSTDYLVFKITQLRTQSLNMRLKE